MQIELINTGSELLLGLVLNTHQQWICRRLSELGYEVSRQIAVPDTSHAIESAVEEAQHRAQLIITTGGLGPTADDATRDCIAKRFGIPLREDPILAKRIEESFAQRGLEMPDSVRRQALIPKGAQVLFNAFGTAPGLIVKLPEKQNQCAHLMMLPGPPRELHPMFDRQVLPWLRKHFPPREFAHRTFHVVGLGESRIEEYLQNRLTPLIARGLKIGYCARIGEVDIRLIAKGKDAKSLVSEASQYVKEKLENAIYGEAEEILESVLLRRFARDGKTLALAESCTGGLIANRLTNVSGASRVLDSAMITYSNEAKRRCLGVSQNILDEHGAVSEATAKAMAEGARKLAGTDYALATTGIAGPTGGSSQKPMGTVFIGLNHSGGTKVKRFFNPFDRDAFKQMTSQQALEMLRQTHDKIGVNIKSKMHRQ